jgi:ribosome biogenesis GTPase / thiamine phosphate phosphatase
LTDHSGAHAPSDIPPLESLGYDERWRTLFAAHAKAGLVPARVVRADRGSAIVAAAHGVVRAEPSSRLRRALAGERREAGGPPQADGPPACGDWVVLDPAPTHEVALIEAVLPRASAFTRGTSDETGAQQVIAANVDTVFVVHPVEPAPHLRRIERELALAWESGATPVVVLTKADLTDEAEARAAAVREVALGVDVVLTSAPTGLGLDLVRAYAREGQTVGLIGPSGVGKSTLINALLGEQRLATREVRVRDARGRHTTVARELVPLPGAGVLLDTPGMRAVVMIDAQEGIAAAFSDIAALAEDCRFRDCTHGGEPGCAVAAAVEAGELPAERLASWHKLQREAQVAAMKTDARLRADEVRLWKMRHKSLRDFNRRTGRHDKP